MTPYDGANYALHMETYEKPQLAVLGYVEDLTLAGNDPCRDQPPRGPKQTGPSDYILGQAALQTCSL